MGKVKGLAEKVHYLVSTEKVKGVFKPKDKPKTILGRPVEEIIKKQFRINLKRKWPKINPKTNSAI